MVWKLRADGDGPPDYGSNSDHFTIRMHHSGKLLNLGSICYLSGSVNYFDFCSEDEISMLEIVAMSKELGLIDIFGFYHSRGRLNDYSELVLMDDDHDAMNLVNFIDEERVTVIYVRHIELDDYENKSIESEGSVDKLVDQYPFDDEETGYIGDADDENIQPNEGTEPVDESDDEVNEPVGENHTEFDSFLDDLLVNDGGLMDMRDSGGSDVQSVGDDSDLSDFLADSEYFDSQDDVSFYENIDIGVEWGGFREPTVNVPRKSERLNKGKQPVVEKPKKIEATHNNFPVFNPKLDMDDPHFELGLCFPDADTFRAAIKQHSRVHGRDLKYKKNDKDKVRAICKHKGCPWMIYASQIRGELTLQVKTIHSVHECTRKEKVTAATSNWLASKYQDKLRTDPNWPINSMMVAAKKECKLLFSTHQMYRATKRANELNRGTHVEQYGLIWRYAEEIRRTNPGTTIKIKTKPAGEDLRFKRIYICWGALKRGLMEGCRRMIFLDGCHLKSTYGGILLCAVGIDANNGMYPFAYAVVEKEKKDSWTWFVDLLKTDLEIGESGGWTIMSDKQKGLIDAVDLLMPNCEHRFCVMHLYSNFKLSHRGLALKNILWQAARASRIVDFERIMRDLGTKDKAAFQWLAKRPAANWSRSFFSTNSKCDTLLNNMCESFNAILVRARGMPIIDMLEDIRLILMKRLHVRRDKMLKHNGDICPVIQKRLDFLKEKSMEFIAHWNGHNQFELEGCYGDRLKVNIDEKTCSCRRWQLSGIPCAHAISAMYYELYT
ncbi:PREDICTED: uncharacterized protein LOC105972477 [Erythranthe guttata]|uniref:uncharacterized protein LOC105972477 n=1 Tax=Erythranthe guttata TaxID=4155 RepID=UPI00064DD370|nr:PREDICTED: uncharacterized protein LOC105972477 [Erythranthe guttata]|eukprot:XP_012852893.1 PREDICTED: uncharacterized protein LOC105972477 [Erythranthe guttata]